MSRRNHFGISAFVGILGLFPLTSSAARLGHPGVSARGATAAATQWNLICDPQYATNGTISTQYDPTMASLSTVSSLGPYMVTQIVVVTHEGDATFFSTITANGGVATVNSAALGGEAESGFVQVSWTLNGAPPSPATDDDTHMLTFNNISGNPTAIGTFTDYMDQGASNPGGIFPTADFYSGFMPDPADMSQTIPFTYSADPNSPNYPGFPPDSETATFQVGTPEPSSAALLGMLATAGLLRRRRNQPHKIKMMHTAAPWHGWPAQVFVSTAGSATLRLYNDQEEDMGGPPMPRRFSRDDLSAHI